MEIVNSLFFALVHITPIVVHKYSNIDDFLLNYKCRSESINFYKVFPLPDTNKAFPKVKGYVGYTDDELLFIIEIKGNHFISSSKGFDNNNVFQGDYAMVAICPYKSREFAYVFAGTPSGGNREFMATQHGFATREWDGLWHYKAVQRENKWIAIFIVPFKTIFFEDSVFYIKGSVNFHEDNLMVSTHYSQPFMSLENMKMIVLDSTISGYSILKINLFPYLRVEKNASYNGNGFVNSEGGNIEVKIKENTIFEGSINPDFSTIDADVISFDLSVEPRYFPEKRKFFLEGAKNFSFDLPVFYTRNIDTVRLGVKGNVEKKHFSLYGLYSRYNTNRQFAGIGVNLYPGGNLPIPYFRGFHDDSISILCAGIRKYVNKFRTFMSMEGAVRTESLEKGIYGSLNRDVYPGFSFGMSYMLLDSNLISPVGKPWYNDKMVCDLYGDYSWVSSKNQQLRASTIGYYRKIKVKSTKEDIFSESSLNMQLIIPSNIFIRGGIRRNVFGTDDVSEGMECAIGKGGRTGNFNMYIFKAIGENDIFISIGGDLFFLESTISYRLDRKVISGLSDTTLLQVWGELPIIKRLYIKPYIKYDFSQRDLHSDIKLFYFINRFTQLAIVGNSDYSLYNHRFSQKAYLIRFQLYFQLF